MIEAMLYQIRVRRMTRAKVEITLVPTWLGRLLKRSVRQGVAYRARSETDELNWWWQATDRFVGSYIERYIETAPMLSIEDMTVEQLLLDEPEPKRKTP